MKGIKGICGATYKIINKLSRIAMSHRAHKLILNLLGGNVNGRGNFSSSNSCRYCNIGLI